MGLTLASSGLSVNNNIKRGESSLKRIAELVYSVRLDMGSPHNRTGYILETFLRSAYL